MTITVAQWSDNVRLSAYDGIGQILAPELAYLGMPPDYRIAAALCDAVMTGRWGWANSIVLWAIGEGKIIERTSSRTERLLRAQGWRTVDDIYDVARVTPRQRIIFTMAQAGYTQREIVEILEVGGKNPLYAVRVQILRATEKVKQYFADNNIQWNVSENESI